MPGRAQMATKYLDAIYDETREHVDTLLTHKTVCLTTDGWTSVNGTSVINYMALTEKDTVFLESLETGEQGHTGEWIARDLIRVIRKYDNIEVAGVVTDNASNNKLAWKLLTKEYPRKFFYGTTLISWSSLLLFRMCCSHAAFAGKGHHSANGGLHLTNERRRQLLRTKPYAEGQAHKEARGSPQAQPPCQSCEPLRNPLVFCSGLCLVTARIGEDLV